MPKKIDLSGKKFGRLFVIRELSRPKGVINTRARWECLCDCGEIVSIDSGNIRNGITSSCGCLRRELTTINHSKHGHATKGISPEYWSWKAMIQRCTNPNNISYKDYGGRGIIVCDKWIESFKSFIEDMGLKPEPSFTIERVDVNGNYKPDNCIWIPKGDQNKNKRNSLKNRGMFA